MPQAQSSRRNPAHRSKKSSTSRASTAQAKCKFSSLTKSEKPVGILGGGQLARMLVLEAHPLGLSVSVLSEKAQDPAAQVTALWQKGDLRSDRDLERFLDACSVVTFESEFLDAEQLQRLAKKTKTPVFPNPATMATVQDRLTQKQLLIDAKLPTAPFYAVETAEQAQRAWIALGRKAVFKKRRFGYDGYGTFMVRSLEELTRFLPELERNPHGFIAEAFIPFDREVAVMIVRSRSEDTVSLPFVETFQENSRCLWVKGPLPSSQELKALGRKLKKFLAKIDYVGVMGVELFEIDGAFTINELAPRVHNSGHYSMNALDRSQFSLHLAAILGHTLKVPKLLQPAFAMINLLGSSTHTPHLPIPTEGHLHWYGKHENRPGRKMGHVNTLAATSAQALSQAKKLHSTFDV